LSAFDRTAEFSFAIFVLTACEVALHLVFIDEVDTGVLETTSNDIESGAPWLRRPCL
jgi:hypothetical protein